MKKSIIIIILTAVVKGFPTFGMSKYLMLKPK